MAGSGDNRGSRIRAMDRAGSIMVASTSAKRCSYGAPLVNDLATPRWRKMPKVTGTRETVIEAERELVLRRERTTKSKAS